MKVICPYCNEEALLVDSAEVYNGTSYGMIWLCRDCDAYVGCHKNSKRHAPLGRLANKKLRLLKRQAHSAFDRLWKRKMIRDDCSKKEARQAGYTWLAKQLGIQVKECHIGMFDEELCRQAIKVCNNV